MIKVVLNHSFGVFYLSDEAWALYGEKPKPSKMNDISFRTDPKLIEIVEKLGAKANNEYTNLVIIEIPEDIEFQIEDYDGREWIAETHKTWGKIEK
jgi:hypothetical protein